MGGFGALTFVRNATRPRGSLLRHLISRFTSEIVWRSFLVLFLFIAAGLCIIFAVRAGEGAFWVVIESVGVALFGGMGLLGLRGSLWWLVAAWALHPLWDVGLHYVGPGRPFASETYTIACLSFDLLVAAYIAAAHGFGLHRGRGPAPRGDAR